MSSCLILGKFLNNCKLLNFPNCKRLQRGLWWLQEIRFIKYIKCEVHALWTARKFSFLTSGMGILAVILQDFWAWDWVGGVCTRFTEMAAARLPVFPSPFPYAASSSSHHFCSVDPACLAWACLSSVVTVPCSHGLLCSHPNRFWTHFQKLLTLMGRRVSDQDDTSRLTDSEQNVNSFM